RVDGRTITGQSEPFTVPQNGVVGAGWMFFVDQTPVPTGIEIASTPTSLGAPGATARLAVTARFSDGSTRDVTADPSTSYATSSRAIATVDATGLVTAVGSGTAVVTVLPDALTRFLPIPAPFPPPPPAPPPPPPPTPAPTP